MHVQGVVNVQGGRMEEELAVNGREGLRSMIYCPCCLVLFSLVTLCIPIELFISHLLLPTLCRY